MIKERSFRGWIFFDSSQSFSLYKISECERTQYEPTQWKRYPYDIDIEE